MKIRTAFLSFALAAAFLLFASGLSGAPWTPLPFDGRIAAARESSDLHAAVAFYEAHPSWPFLPADLKAAALSYYDLLQFPKALLLLKRLPEDAEARAHLVSLDISASDFEMKKATAGLPKFRVMLLEAVHRRKTRGGWGEPELLEFQPSEPPLPTALPLIRIRAEMLAAAEKPAEAYGLLMAGLRRCDRYLPFYLFAVKLLNDVRSEGPVLHFLERAAELGADRFLLAFERGRYFLNRGDLKSAERWFDEAVALKPMDARARLLRGDCRRFLGRKAEAMDDYRAAYNRDPTLTVALVNLAILSFESGEVQVAAQLFDEAVAADPTFASAWIERANFLAALGMIEEAQRDYLKAAELTPKDPYPLFRLAEARLKHGDYDLARKFAEAALERKPDFAPALVVLGDIARATGDMAAAARYYRKALESAPRDFTAARSLAAALLSMRDVQGARKAAITALSTYDRDPLANYILAMADLARGKTDAARNRFQFLIDEDVGYAPAWYGLALLEFMNGRSTVAVSHLETAIRWKPDPAYVMFRTQLALLEPAFALDDVESVVSLLADRADRLLIQVVRASLARDTNALRAALEELAKTSSRAKMAALLLKALESDSAPSRPPSLRPPERTVATFYLALVLYAKGMDDAAMRMLRFNLRSGDYLTPEYHLSSVFAARIGTAR